MLVEFARDKSRVGSITDQDLHFLLTEDSIKKRKIPPNVPKIRNRLVLLIREDKSIRLIQCGTNPSHIIGLGRHLHVQCSYVDLFIAVKLQNIKEMRGLRHVILTILYNRKKMYKILNTLTGERNATCKNLINYSEGNNISDSSSCILANYRCILATMPDKQKVIHSNNPDAYTRSWS